MFLLGKCLKNLWSIYHVIVPAIKNDDLQIVEERKNFQMRHTLNHFFSGAFFKSSLLEKARTYFNIRSSNSLSLPVAPFFDFCTRPSKPVYSCLPCALHTFAWLSVARTRCWVLCSVGFASQSCPSLLILYDSAMEVFYSWLSSGRCLETKVYLDSKNMQIKLFSVPCCRVV